MQSGYRPSWSDRDFDLRLEGTCTFLDMDPIRVVAAILLILIFLWVRHRVRLGHVADGMVELRTERANANAIIDDWLQQGGDWNWPSPAQRQPTDELLGAIAVVYSVDVMAPKMFKPFFDPAPPESIQRLKQAYRRIGLDALANNPLADVPHKVFSQETFNAKFRDTLMLCRALAIRRGWRP